MVYSSIHDDSSGLKKVGDRNLGFYFFYTNKRSRQSHLSVLGITYFMNQNTPYGNKFDMKTLHVLKLKTYIISK